MGIGWNRERIRHMLKGFYLSEHSWLSVRAAGLLFENKVISTIAFVSGKTAGSDLPSEAAEMKKLLLHLFPDIPAEVVFCLEESHDTPTNAAEIKAFMSERQLDESQVALMTVGFHMLRVYILCRNHALTFGKYFVSEDQIEFEENGFASRYNKRVVVKLEKQKEGFLRFLLRFDPLGEWPKKMTSFTRRKS